jgi:hypothetical protein
MALLDKLTTAGSNLSGLNGTTPSIPNFAGSKLHDTYSINDIPVVPRKTSSISIRFRWCNSIKQLQR